HYTNQRLIMEIYSFNINNNPYEVKIVSIQGKLATVEVNGIEYSVDISDIGDLDISAPKKQAPAQAVAAGKDSIVSPMPGQVFKILVSEGDSVKVGDIVVTIEAMKMENQVRSTTDGKVSQIHVNEGDVVAEGAPLVSLGG
ncbi:MAG: biotin/lipoyl-binding protein, partial [Gammaproteobacteria bacterium]|nr:biotin/lipoyl-binding protein [Gammaproteobacteria bacterium]